MISLRIETKSPCDVRVGRGALARAVESVAATRCAVLSDEVVAPLYRDRLRGLEHAPSYAIAPGEASKCLDTAEAVLAFLAANQLERSSALIALGGGVVGDVGGFCAAVYMRGIALVSCPTTLLAQVDSSIGGKNALNLPQGKNLIGAIHQPRAVYADVDVLASLSAEEYRSGLGEVLKTALIAGPQSLERLEQRAEALACRDPEALEDVVAECVRTKGALVEQDEHDAHVRKRLNLGHTFAHGLEHALGFGQVPHGVAVACGLGLALACARDLDLLEDRELPERVVHAAGLLGLPAHPGELGVSLNPELLLSSMRLDKKRCGEEHRLVLPRSAGDISYDVPVGEDFLARFLRRELRAEAGTRNRD